MRDTGCFIHGEHVATPRTYENIDPSTGEVIGTVSRGGADEVDQAVNSGASIQSQWSRMPPLERAHLLIRLATLIRRDGEQLARIESEDTGKPLTQARADAIVCARYFEFYGHAIDSYYGHTIPATPDLLAYTIREPYGVVGHVLAWNYPMQLLARTVAPAIATGNVSIVKPADETPRSAVMLAELAISAGIPAGVFNIVTGIGSEAGAALTEHPRVAHIGFVGSTAIGSMIAHAAARRVVPTVLELGGKSAQIVFPDADLDKAATLVTNGILQNAGQTCSAGSRLLVHESVQSELIERIIARFRTVTIGPGLLDRDLGPLISRKQQKRVEGFISEVPAEKILYGGFPPESPADLSTGSYFMPTIINDVDPKSRIAQEEVFGPVLVANSFADEEEAVQLANGTEYALVGAVWTSDISRAHRMASKIQAGQVYVNTFGAGGGVEFPFGGFRKSGYGREKGYQALDSYTQSKTVMVKL